MIIIVEGPDGAGKSTLINKLLASHPGSIYKHFGKPENEDEANNYWKVYAKAVKDAPTTGVTIFDRSWYSDLVYGPVLRNRTEMDQMHVEMLESMVITNGGGFVVYCTAPTRLLWARCKQRGETLIKDVETLNLLANTYKTVMSTNCSLPVIRYDTSY
jgi:GTPase SAR1 family protein